MSASKHRVALGFDFGRFSERSQQSNRACIYALFREVEQQIVQDHMESLERFGSDMNCSGRAFLEDTLAVRPKLAITSDIAFCIVGLSTCRSEFRFGWNLLHSVQIAAKFRP